MKTLNIKKYIFSFVILAGMTLTSCRKLIEVAPPNNNITSENTYKTDLTAASVLSSLYLDLKASNNFGSGGVGFGQAFYYTGLSSDELTLFNTNNPNALNYFKNDLQTNNSAEWWGSAYYSIYTANAALEGISASSTISQKVKNQLLGEAKFMRAFNHFYLTNLIGDIPLVLTTNYTVNASIKRSSQSVVYNQIISDLEDAVGLMSVDYLDGTATKVTEERVRPNKWVAKALLARVYLYTKNWAKAEATSNDLINKTDLFDMSNVKLDEVFLKNSKETIWSLQPIGGGADGNSGEGKVFILPSTGPNRSNYPVYLNDVLLADFENNDQRKLKWVGKSGIYSYPNKYKAGRLASTTSEYSIVFRIAEQYLIRAESKINQNRISEGIDDLNLIRRRATNLNDSPASQLAPLATNMTAQNALEAVLHEREVELFTEWGHRWMDLKRTNHIDSRMNVITPIKGGGQWKPYQALYPIPLSELRNNIGLTGFQNPGYTQ